MWRYSNVRMWDIVFTSIPLTPTSHSRHKIYWMSYRISLRLVVERFPNNLNNKSLLLRDVVSSAGRILVLFMFSVLFHVAIISVRYE